MPDPKVEIINPPANEPQPDRQAQLDNDLSKLFDSPGAEGTINPKEVHKADDKPQVPTEAKKEEPKAEKENKSPVPETEKDEVDDIKPGTKAGFITLRENYKKNKKILVEKDEKIAKLEVALAERGQTTSKELEDLKKERDDLKGYRAMVDYQADPEFIKTYEEPLQEKLDEIKEILTGLKVEESVIDRIDYTNTAGLTAAKRLIASQGGDEILADDFFSAAKEANRMMKKRDEVLAKYRKEYKEVIETKKKESFTKQAENEGRMQKHLEAIAQMKNEHGELRFEFLVDKVAKDPTNSAEVAQVEHANKIYAAIREQVLNLMKAESPEDRAELAVAAGYAKLADARMRAVLKKNESLQAEIAKLSKVSSETPKTQRSRTATTSGNGEMNLDLDAALSNFRATI